MSFYVDIHAHRPPKDENIVAVVDLSSQENPDFSALRYASYGIHPWYLTEENAAEKLRRLETALQSGILAIGEVGFDKLRGAEMNLQERAFQEVAVLSEQYQNPLIIHCVKAWEQLLAARKSSKTALPWMAHGFHGSPELAKQLLEHGFYLSFGEKLLQDSALQKTFSLLPLEKIFLESDDAEISIEELYLCAATSKRIDVETLKQQICENFKKAFNPK